MLEERSAQAPFRERSVATVTREACSPYKPVAFISMYPPSTTRPARGGAQHDFAAAPNIAAASL
jgi:hypothetical protein